MIRFVAAAQTCIARWQRPAGGDAHVSETARSHQTFNVPQLQWEQAAVAV